MPVTTRIRHLVALGALLCSAGAAAEPASATCDRLLAEARSEALLHYAPRVEVVAARLPDVADPADVSSPAVAGLQARVALALSPVEMLRGRAIEGVAAAECVRDRLAAHIGAILAVGARHGERAAANAELAYLEDHLPEIDALVDETALRFERQRATAFELDDLRDQRAVLRVHAADLRHTASVLAELDEPLPAVDDLETLAAAYRAAALEVARRQGAMRELGAWRVDLRGGLSAGERADWFAMVELGYSLGGPLQGAAERRARRARATELAGDERELAVRLDRLRRAMRHSVEALALEAQRIDEDLALLRGEVARVVGNSSDAARLLRARLTIRIIATEARRASVAALAAARRPLAGGSP